MLVSFTLSQFPKGTRDAETAIKMAKRDLEKADEALDLLEKVLEQTVPWHLFSDALFEMDKHRSEYSAATAALILEIKRHLLDSMDNNFRATRSVYGWCNVVSHLLTAYIDLFDNINREKSAAQKAILLEILNTGIDKMSIVQYDLDAISMNFTDASMKLSLLQVRLDTESVKKGDRSKMQELNEIFNMKMESVKRFYSQLKNDINNAFSDIEKAKTKLNDEIRSFRNLKQQTDETNSYQSSIDAALRDSVVRVAENLSNKCNEYIKRHN